MTQTPHRLHDCSPRLDRSAIELRWSAIQAGSIDPLPNGTAGAAREGSHRHVVFVLSLQPVDDDHAFIEGWLDTPAGPHDVIPRQTAEWLVTTDGEQTHVDLEVDGHRVLALSYESADAGDPVLLYARCTLLDRAGLGPGGYDPPRATFVRSPLERSA